MTQATTRSGPASRPATLVSRHDVELLVRRCLDDVEGRLGFRPDVHLDWPSRTRVSVAVGHAVRDALDESLAQLGNHIGATSAFASVAWRDETVEVCVVDDGRPPANRLRRPAAHLDEATGLEHDVDDYGLVGTCQWWSIPMDLVETA
jgi:hypothetical protein